MRSAVEQVLRFGGVNMRQYKNGQYVDMTEEEVAALFQDNVEHEPTVEERVAELEEALALLLSGVME